MKIRLRYRLAALTLACLLPVVTLSVVAILRIASGYLWREAELDAVRLAETVRRATRHAMMIFDRQRIADALVAISRQRGVDAVRLYDASGTLRLPPTGPARLDPGTARCLRCHPDPRTTGRLPGGACTHWSGNRLTLYYPIRNESACARPACHPPPDQARLLGFLEVVTDNAGTAEMVRTLEKNGAFWGGMVLLAAAVPLLLGLRRAMERPMSESLRIVREISRDNLSVRSRLRPRDEWGELLDAFDSMTGALQDARTELEALNRDLENQVAERTRELEKALEAARESDRIKTEFLANISHEFSTPLQGVIGYSELLLDGIDGVLTAEQGSDVERILRNGRRLLHLVEDLLELARLEGRRRFLCIDKVRLADVAEDAAEAGARLAEGKPVQVDLEIAPDCPLVLGDVGALRRVFIHLVENAVRYTLSGRVSIRVAAEGGGGGFTVEDTGPGMYSDVLRAALQGFSSKGGGGGLSVGLSLAKRLVELHGGSLQVESTPGQGTRVAVTLPAAPDGEG